MSTKEELAERALQLAAAAIQELDRFAADANQRDAMDAFSYLHQQHESRDDTASGAPTGDQIRAALMLLASIGSIRGREALEEDGQ